MTHVEQNRTRPRQSQHPIAVNRHIDQEIGESVRRYSGQTDDETLCRIRELDREWDIERMLEAMASSFSLTGLVLGIAVDRRWLALPGVVLPFLLMHAVQGWCPPVPVLRRLGVRTREEIDRERYALKALIGDFTGARTPSQALAAASR